MNNIKLFAIPIVLVAVILGALFFASGNDVTDEGDVLQVSSTIFPLHDIVRNVGGEHVNAKLLLPPGASPHYYEFTPRQLQNLQGTRIIFSIGHGLDEWALEVHDALDDATVVTVDDRVELREFDYSHDEDHGPDDEHEHGPVDPHYWLSTQNAVIISENVADALSDEDPENEDAYRENAERYISELNEAREDLLTEMSGTDIQAVITLHDAWYYFADDLGIEVVGSFEPSAGEQPSPGYLSRLQSLVIEHNVQIMITEPQLSNDAMRSFATDLGLNVVVLDPVGGVEGRDSYIDLMRYNVNTMANAFKE